MARLPYYGRREAPLSGTEKRYEWMMRSLPRYSQRAGRLMGALEASGPQSPYGFIPEQTEKGISTLMERGGMRPEEMAEGERGVISRYGQVVGAAAGGTAGRGYYSPSTVQQTAQGPAATGLARGLGALEAARGQSIRQARTTATQTAAGLMAPYMQEQQQRRRTYGGYLSQMFRGGRRSSMFAQPGRGRFTGRETYS